MRPLKGDMNAGGNRSWKRPASASESDRRPDRKQVGNQQLGGSDNERDRRYCSISIFLFFRLFRPWMIFFALYC